MTRHANNKPTLDRLTQGCTLDAYRQHPVSQIKSKNELLSIVQGVKTKIKKLTLLSVVILALNALQGAIPAHAANYSPDVLRVYAHSRILDWKEFTCFNAIINKESRWNYKARNGSHYGLGQMRSEYYRDLDPFRQIDQTLKYVFTRYSTPCKAWAFHKERNYF
jgi:hypothetical protein